MSAADVDAVRAVLKALREMLEELDTCLALGCERQEIFRHVNDRWVGVDPHAPRGYVCAVCHRNPVAAEAGYDTCAECLARK